MRPLKSRRARLSSRPFFVSTFIITLIATYALLVRGPRPAADDRSLLRGRAGGSDEDCRFVHAAKDQCAFIRANCQDDEAGLLQYLTFYYCSLGHVQPVAFAVLVVWMGLLFTTIGIAASDFFSVNLSTIASILGLSESLAGVTFLAFGNGSPDVFSTFAAMGSNSGSMAVGELIGAASFITAVVAGSMALVREFKVSKKTYVRDICFFIASVSFAMVFLADGWLQLWECCVMIGFYLFYVITVVGWHWLSTRRKRRRAKEAAARANFYGSRAGAVDELEPYRDNVEEDDETTPLNRRRDTGTDDISALERGPRIELNAPRGAPDDEDEDEELGRHITAEMTSSMRVSRPQGRRSNTTITPIRPSLVGVLEFRSVLASLQRSGNVHLAPMHGKTQSSRHPGLAIEQSTASLGVIEDDATVPPASSSRDRALSSGAIPLNLDNSAIPPPTIAAGASSNDPPTIAAAGTSIPRGHRGIEAPPSPTATQQSGSQAAPFNAPAMPPNSPALQLRIPSPQRLSPHSSPALSPFPRYSESPPQMSAGPLQRTPSFMLPTPGVGHRTSFPGFDEHELPKPVSWWPYNILPPPHILFGTLFPTLRGWRDKSIWDKFVSTISVPSIFLLVTTLPVVETERRDDEPGDAIVDFPDPGEPGNMAAPVSVERHASIRPETEWQRYRRSTQSNGSRSQSYIASPVLIALDDPEQTSGAGAPAAAAQQQPAQPAPALESDSQTATDDEVAGWNRWLVAVQIFAGPLFTVFIVWANMAEDMQDPQKMLIRLVLYSLLGSLVLLALLLLTTSPDKRPKYHLLFCFLGFVISIAWISTIAGEVVGVLKAFGIILGISEAILGLTIFAVGNSVGDLVADVTVARLGYPVMALSACFGGPMLNILLGVGIGGAWMTTSAAKRHHVKHPDRPVNYKPYHIQVGGTLMISAITVLLTLIFLLIAVPTNKWVMSRKIGFSLITIWTISTIINVIVEVTGFWKDVA